jgi:hypothetical protein
LHKTATLNTGRTVRRFLAEQRMRSAWWMRTGLLWEQAELLWREGNERWWWWWKCSEGSNANFALKVWQFLIICHDGSVTTVHVIRGVSRTSTTTTTRPHIAQHTHCCHHTHTHSQCANWTLLAMLLCCGPKLRADVISRFSRRKVKCSQM